VQAPVKDQKAKSSNGAKLNEFASIIKINKKQSKFLNFLLDIDYRKKTRGTNKKDEEAESKRKEHQKNLLRLKQEELEERLKSGSFSLTQTKA